MSDISAAVEGDGDANAPRAFDDAQILEIAQAMLPLIEEAMSTATKTAIESTPVPIIRPGTCEGFNPSTLTATCRMDDETSTISAQVAGEWPIPGDRVLCVFAPGGAAWVLSPIGHGGVPPGSCIAFLGPIAVDTPGSTPQSAPPPGFARPYGQLGTVGQYPGLYYYVGTTHNTGGEDPQLGQFRFPDARGRIFLGLDNMGGTDAGRISSIANTVGVAGGGETHTLATANLPSHTHSLPSHDHTFTGTVSGSVGSGGEHSHSTNAHALTGSGGVPVWDGANGSAGFFFAPSSWAGATVYSDGSHTHTLSGSVSGTTGAWSGTSGAAGSGSAVNHLPPVMMCNWLIKL